MHMDDAIGPEISGTTHVSRGSGCQLDDITQLPADAAAIWKSSGLTSLMPRLVMLGPANSGIARSSASWRYHAMTAGRFRHCREVMGLQRVLGNRGPGFLARVMRAGARDDTASTGCMEHLDKDRLSHS